MPWYNKHILMKIGLLGQPYSDSTHPFCRLRTSCIITLSWAKIVFKLRNNCQKGHIYHLWWLTHVTEDFGTCLRCLKTNFDFSLFLFFFDRVHVTEDFGAYLRCLKKILIFHFFFLIALKEIVKTYRGTLNLFFFFQTTTT